MKILLSLMKLDIGGAETHILELAKELKKRGNVVYVASNGGKDVCGSFAMLAKKLQFMQEI